MATLLPTNRPAPMMPPIVIIVTWRGRSACERRCCSWASRAAVVLFIITSLDLWQLNTRSVFLDDHRRALLGHHDAGRIGVARTHRREHRGVNDAQRLESMHAKPGIDHGLRSVRAHAAGAQRRKHGA